LDAGPRQEEVSLSAVVSCSRHAFAIADCSACHGLCDINDDMEVTNEESSQQDPDVTREGKIGTRAFVAISSDTPEDQPTVNARTKYKRKKTVRITPSTMAKSQR
jgi:formylmethanofuran dehydrogenase subunit B